MKKLLWHKKNERPKFNEIVGIILFTNNGDIRIADFIEGWDWKIFCIERKIKKWCYISELKQDNIFLEAFNARQIDIESIHNMVDALVLDMKDGMYGVNDAQRFLLLEDVYKRLQIIQKLLNPK